MVLCEQVLIPAIPTVLRDHEQLGAEVIGRLRYTRGTVILSFMPKVYLVLLAENSHFLNTLVEQAMTWVDNYTRQPLLVPLSCWIAPPIMKKCRTFTIKGIVEDWKPGQTVLAPTFNHQHVLISGNQSAVGVIYMYHIAAQSLMTTFIGKFFVSKMQNSCKPSSRTHCKCDIVVQQYKRLILCEHFGGQDSSDMEPHECEQNYYCFIRMC
ncbi:unnamed protein product [Cylicostephanus goldi]|uniref:Uncharacterized protein n=1 Tax=Cylicostephanus goldi TaxID=71465 RepID=A0A3P6RHM2_CYLGO|nr:unnamed protein product [Cylicostephanus goldi]